MFWFDCYFHVKFHDWWNHDDICFISLNFFMILNQIINMIFFQLLKIVNFFHSCVMFFFRKFDENSEIESFRIELSFFLFVQLQISNQYQIFNIWYFLFFKSTNVLIRVNVWRDFWCQQSRFITQSDMQMILINKQDFKSENRIKDRCWFDVKMNAFWFKSQH